MPLVRSFSGLGDDLAGQVFQFRQYAVQIRAHQKDYDPRRPDPLEFPDRVRGTPLAFTAEYGVVEALGVASSVLGHCLDTLDAVREFINALDDRQPAITPLDYALERARIVDATDEDRRMG